MKRNIQIIVGIFAFILLIFLGKYGYEYYKYEMNVSIEEKEKRKIDEYNFEQLQKVKDVLKNVSEEEMKFRDLADFNKKYSQNIEPIKNCYYMVTTNFFDDYIGDSSYIYGFQIESNKYKEKYGEEYYAYPQYDLPVWEVCAPSSFTGNPRDIKSSCSDMTRGDFIWTISNPCRE